MSTISPYALGATLYMPATRHDLADVVLNGKIPGLRSLVICLEDAVSDSDVEGGVENLKELLANIDRAGGRTRSDPVLFVRPRNIEMAKGLNDLQLIHHADGFVAPKLNLPTLQGWQQAMTNPSLMVMPTLETRDVFDPVAMVELRDALAETLKKKILALRIGGNDLMGCLGLRRSSSHTLYSTPMGYVIPMLAGIMGAAGFYLTAPVFERLDNDQLFSEELELDLLNGLVGKTAIHPSQIQTIHEALRVSIEDLNSARLIMSDDAKAVFKHGGAMCEPATHLQWAQAVVERAQWHGVRHGPLVPVSTESKIRVATNP
ncbi:MAG: citrate lyase [Pseudomonas sp.]|nr:citrate lyase [Pseudomonas sp.]MBB52366.1 citrate lyase [Pseudomonadales bacterium]|tara:strand:+ start:151 stop:1104 length:954 start_codon:yes stop_codon:yes gene_type:complete